MPKLLRRFVFLLLTLAAPACLAQDLTAAHKTIDTLSSPYMQGRGYVKNGDQLAAKYLAKQYKQLHLKKFRRSYFQSFSFPVNTFPGKIALKSGEQLLVPGQDFLVSPASPSCAVSGVPYYINDSVFSASDFLEKLFSSRFTDNILVFDVTKKKELANTIGEMQFLKYQPKAIVTLQPDKLTWSVASSIDKIPAAELLKTAYDPAAATLSLTVENFFQKKHRTQNVIGYVKGKQFPDSFIVFTAHYDHLGRMGQALFPGANDNASGVALLLELAKYYNKPENAPSCSIAFICFAGEEAGLVGSAFYTQNPAFPLSKIRFLINLDLTGTGEEGITVVNATEYKKQFETLEQLNKQNNYLPDVKRRGKAANSDHYWFSEKGVPSFFIYTMGPRKAYHDIYDVPQTLTLAKFGELFLLLTAFEKELSKN